MTRPNADPYIEQAPAEQPLLVLINAMGARYREYLLSAVARRHRVWLFQDRPCAWGTPYLVGQTVLDTTDVDAMVAAAKTLNAGAVLCWDETRIVAAAMVAAALGLPGNEPDTVRRCRDKHLTRTCLAEAAVPQPRSAAVATLAEAMAAADRIGYPVVVKPRALTGSFGVAKVSTPDELVRHFAHTGGTPRAEVPERFHHAVMVEQYVPGPEISVDAACVDGRLTPLFLARKQLGFAPYFEELGHVVDAGDPLLTDPDILRILVEAHAAVGFQTGWTHTELRLAPDGPRLIEINARLGGDLIPHLGLLATGIDPGQVVADIACAVAPALRPTTARVAGVRFVYPERDLTVGKVEVATQRLPRDVERVVVLAEPGQRLDLPPAGHVSSRAAAIIAVADTVPECERALAAAEPAVRVHAAPAEPAA